MNRNEIGKTLTQIRNGRRIEGMTGYTIRSIEESRSSYPVSNLITFCNSVGTQITITDTNVGETLPIISVSQCHEVLKTLMDRYEMDKHSIFRVTGVHYTYPKGDKQPLSIDTLLSVCKAMNCEIGLRN